MGFITGSWENVHLYCGAHQDELVEMQLKEGPHSLFYACPKYYPDNRKEGEHACYNRLNLVDCEKMLSTIADMIIEADSKGEIVDLTNYSWTKKGITYKILHYSPSRLDVSVFNKPSMQGTKLPS